MTPEEFGYLMSYTGIVSAVNSFFGLGPLTKAGFSTHRLLQTSTLLLLIGYFWMSYPGYLLVYLCLHAVVSLASTVIHTFSINEFVNAISKTDTGLAMGVAASIQSLASGVFAPLVGGFFTQFSGSESPNVIASVITVMQFYLYAFY